MEAAQFGQIRPGSVYRDLLQTFMGQDESGKGRGADFEGQLITLDIYNAKSRSLKFVPILFSPECAHFIPDPLLGTTSYLLDSDSEASVESYSVLLAFLYGKAGVTPFPLSQPKSFERRKAEPLSFPVRLSRDPSEQNPIALRSDSNISPPYSIIRKALEQNRVVPFLGPEAAVVARRAGTVWYPPPEKILSPQ